MRNKIHVTRWGPVSGGSAAAVIGLALWCGQAVASSVSPQIDFRDEAFAAAHGQDSFSFEFQSPAGGTVDTTVSGFSFNGTENVAAPLWQDGTDGLGIATKEADEIDSTESLRIEFDRDVGISELFFADLFATEGPDNWSEGGVVEYDDGSLLSVNGSEIAGNWGNPANGEAYLDLGKIVSVRSMTFSANPGMAGQADFALLGFTDPAHVPEPAPLTLFAIGLLAVSSAFFRFRIH